MMSTDLGRHTREEIKRLAPGCIAILPVCAVEQHGYHLPLYTDYRIGSDLAHRICSEVQRDFPALVCPAIPYGNSHHHFPHPTLSLTSETLIRVLKDLVASLALTGFKRIFILNSHGGNDEAIRIVARDGAREHGVDIGAASYWTLAYDKLIALYEREGIPIGRVPGHAGDFETSLMLVLDEETVHLDRRPAPRADAAVKAEMKNRIFVQRPGNSVGQDGFSDDARRAAPEIGRLSLDVIVREAAEAIREFARLTETAGDPIEKERTL